MSLLTAAFAAMFGGAAAAFVPRVGYRLAVPRGTSPRSGCADCSRPFLPGPDGWVRAGAACPCAPGPRVVVPVAAATAGLLGLFLGPAWILPALLAAVILGALLAVIDVRCLRLPDRLVGAMACVTGLPTTLSAAAGGHWAVLGRSLFAAVVVGSAYLVVAVWSGGALGIGDVKLAAVLSHAVSFAGWPAVLIGLIATHVINGSIAVFLLLTGRARRRTAVPLGPALLVGALLAVLATAGPGPA